MSWKYMENSNIKIETASFYKLDTTDQGESHLSLVHEGFHNLHMFHQCGVPVI